MIKRYRLAALLLMVVLATAACSPSPTPAPTATSATTSTSTIVPSNPVESVTHDMATTPAQSSYTLVRVVDGDTIDVKGPDGMTVRVRLIGINAPEHDECYGPESADFLRRLLGDTPLLLWRPEMVPQTDRYGRQLRYVEDPSGSTAGASLITAGFAVAYEVQPHPYAEQYAQSQRDAESAKLGMWGACFATSVVQISDVEANPPGPDGDDLNGEYAVVVNSGDVTLDLTGWVLADNSSTHRYRFMTQIRPGTQLRVHTGCGTDTDTDLYWCAKSPVWNNDGDLARLFDASGITVSTLIVEG